MKERKVVTNKEEFFNLINSIKTRPLCVFFKPQVLLFKAKDVVNKNLEVLKTHTVVKLYTKRPPSWMLEMVNLYKQSRPPEAIKINGQLFKSPNKDYIKFALLWGCLIIDESNKYYLNLIIPREVKNEVINTILAPMNIKSSYIMVAPKSTPQLISHFVIVDSEEAIRDFIEGIDNINKVDTDVNYIY